MVQMLMVVEVAKVQMVQEGKLEKLILSIFLIGILLKVRLNEKKELML